MSGIIRILPPNGSRVTLNNMPKNSINVDAILLEMRDTQGLVQQEINLEELDENVIDESIPEFEEALEEYVTVS